MSEIIKKTTDYSQGDEAGMMDFMLLVDHGGPNAIVWLESQNDLPNGKPISIPPTTIPKSTTPVMVGTQVFVPAGWTSPITYAYDPNGQPVPADLVFDLQVFYVIQPGAGTATARGARIGARQPAGEGSVNG